MEDVFAAAELLPEAAAAGLDEQEEGEKSSTEVNNELKRKGQESKEKKER